MTQKYVRIGVHEVLRGDKVEFRYLPGKQVNHVAGWIDKITGRCLYVGNEYHMETTGMEIYHVKKYKKDKIESLEKLVFINDHSTNKK